MNPSESVPAQYCSTCNLLKPLTEYYFRNDTGQYRRQCKDCRSGRDRQYYKNNRDYILEQKKQYHEDNRDYILKYKQQYFQNNKERIYDYRRYRYHTDDTFRITSLLRGRLYHAMNSQSATKYDNTMNLVGCSPEWLTEWLNYTKSIYCDNETEETHIDHVFPLSAYDLFNPIEQQIAMNWANLRVIPARMNQTKGNTMPSLPEINEHQQLINFFLNSHLENGCH